MESEGLTFCHYFTLQIILLLRWRIEYSHCYNAQKRIGQFIALTVLIRTMHLNSPKGWDYGKVEE